MTQQATSVDRVVSASIKREKYPTLLSAGSHTITVDEPAELGGANTGPTPQDLLLAALASCTAITVRMYADRKGWPLDRCEAVATGSRSTQGVLESVRLAVRLEGKLDQDQRARLTEIAARCPVHRALVSGVAVDVVPE